MKLVAIFSFFCISLTAFSQSTNRLTDTEYLRLRDRIKTLSGTRADSAFTYAEQMEKSDVSAHKAFALMAKSYLIQMKGDSITSKKYAALAFDYLKKVPPGAEKVKLNAYMLNYNGLAEWKRLNLNKALQSYNQGKAMSKSIGDIIQVIKFNNNISSVYADAKNYRLAIRTAKESDRLTDLNVNLYEKEKYDQSKTTVCYKLGCFYELEFFTDETNRVLLDSAEYYYKKTLIYSNHTATNNVSAQLNLAKIYHYKGNADQAGKMYLALLKRSRDYLTSDNFKYLNLNLGELYFKQKKYNEALMCFAKVDSVHQVNSNYPVAYYYSNYFQAKIFNQLNNHEKALEHSKIFLENYDKTETKSMQEASDVNFIASKEISSKEIQEIEKSNKRSVLLKWISIGLLVLIVGFVICFLIWKNQQKKKDIQKAMLLIEEFKQQIEKSKNNEVHEVLPKKESPALSIDEEKENEIIRKLQELEDKLVFLNQDYTQQFVAKKIKTNTAYLSLVVNKRFGKTFSEYANELKINYVINELITNPTYRKYSTQAIAESAGFKKANSFTISFKKRTGLTPVQFADKIESEYSV
ncbi:helix-turn-helix domain-containing protein [Flavobacterium amniphilum]|uniref:helix-turn-helix domain-containing protein n=1 Tax=Flavobacterium amniphilum TaxID=1834035 RepID=UPI00202A4397|nr:helix-turn-helix domain-containing protein [Flavobacterium amniphilum]MCL9806098.1 helix-turn-helix domain-containing protein [Flavobacterium amniphilum]